ncbi:unnamed protein product [Malus baccata var. baccata]
MGRVQLFLNSWFSLTGYQIEYILTILLLLSLLIWISFWDTGVDAVLSELNFCMMSSAAAIVLEARSTNCHLTGVMKIIMQNLIDRLRPLVGLKGWDYCVLWKLSEDQRFIEWMDCCCSGTDGNTQTNGGQELLFPVYPVLPCRDIMHHSRTNSCDLLAQLPSSLPLESGIYAQALISNQIIWLNSTNRDLSHMERDETRVLVPSGGGLIELFVSRDVSEDQQVIDFITAQCNISHEQDILLSASCNASTNTSFTVDINNMSNDIRPKAFLVDDNGGNDHLNNNHSFQQQPVFPAMALDHNSNLPCDISVDQIGLCSTSPMNFLQNSNNNNVYNFDQGSHESLGEMGLQADTNAQNLHNNIQVNEGIENIEQQVVDDQDSIKHEGGRTADHSASDCSDQFDDDGGTNYRRRTGKKPQSKNLVAERKRRKKLNERLYHLRSLVPNISKMDKASILGDAIEFVKELQRQEKELQEELEQHSDDGGSKKRNSNNICGNHTNFQPETLSQNGNTTANKQENDELPNGFHVGTAGDIGNISKQKNQDSDITKDRGQEMEPQVGVTQLDGNEFFVTVFCEHKPGGFVRLMEALDSLGLEVTNANVTSFRSLVSNVFKVEKKDTEIVQADHVRDSLLEITRNPSSKGWPEMIAKASGNVSPLDHFQHDHHQQHHLHDYHASSYHLQHLYS